MTDSATPRPGTGRFENDDGLVVEVVERVAADSLMSFDIFDASLWPGGDEEGKEYAALITRAVNRDHRFEEMREALSIAETWMMRITDEVLDGEGSRPEYAAAQEQVRAILAKIDEAG